MQVQVYSSQYEGTDDMTTATWPPLSPGPPRRTQVTHKYGSIHMHSRKRLTSSIFVSTWQIPTVPTTTTTRSQATCAIRHQLGRHHTKPTCWSVTPSSPLGRCHAVPTFLERPTSNWNSRPNSPGNTSRQHTDSRVVPRQVPGFRRQILRTTQYRNIANIPNSLTPGTNHSRRHFNRHWFIGSTSITCGRAETFLWR